MAPTLVLLGVEAPGSFTKISTVRFAAQEVGPAIVSGAEVAVPLVPTLTKQHARGVGRGEALVANLTVKAKPKMSDR